MLHLAVQYYGESRFAKAEELLQALVRLCPDDARPWQLLGSIMILNNRRIKAEAYYQRALELKPDEPYTLVALAEIALDALRIDQALPLLKRLFALDPDSKLAPANRGRLLLKQAYERLQRAG
jgi:predicted Zn-dependent protease